MAAPRPRRRRRRRSPGGSRRRWSGVSTSWHSFGRCSTVPRTDWTPYLFTLLGPPGIGKSRLAYEFAAFARRRGDVVTGHCLPYGEGITFWPLVEIVRQLAGENPREALAELLVGEDDADLDRRTSLGRDRRVERASASEETFLAVRRLFEVVARARPLVVRARGHALGRADPARPRRARRDWTRDAPIFLLCLGTPRPARAAAVWGGGKLNATSILLEPLSDAESDTLMINLLVDVRLRRGDARAHRRDRAAATRSSSSRCLHWSRGRGKRRAISRAAEHPGPARCPDRPAAAGRARRARARVGRAATSSRQSAVADLSPPEAREAVGARAADARPPRAVGPLRSPSPEGRCLPLPSHPDPRRRVRVAHQAGTRRAARAPRRPARGADRSAAAARARRSSATTSSRLIAGASSSALRRAGAGAGPPGCAAARRGRARARMRVATCRRRSICSHAAERLVVPGAPGRPELLADLAEALRETGDLTARRGGARRDRRGGRGLRRPRARGVRADEPAAPSGGRGSATIDTGGARAGGAPRGRRLRGGGRRTAARQGVGAARVGAVAAVPGGRDRGRRCCQAIEHAQPRRRRSHRGAEPEPLPRRVFFGPASRPRGDPALPGDRGRDRRAAADPSRRRCERSPGCARWREASTRRARSSRSAARFSRISGLKVTAASASETAAIVELLADDPAAAERDPPFRVRAARAHGRDEQLRRPRRDARAALDAQGQVRRGASVQRDRAAAAPPR